MNRRGALLATALLAVAAALAAVVLAVSRPGSETEPNRQTAPVAGQESQNGDPAPPVVISEDDPLIEGVYSTTFFLPRDAIGPLYQPQFIPGKPASLDPEELVMGVEINGESKAYPVGPLSWKEMVNDEVGGVPVLVTW